MEPVQIQQNNLLANISSILREFSLTFEVIFLDITKKILRSIVHVTDKEDYSVTVLGVYLNKRHKIKKSFPVNGNTSYFYEVKQDIELKHWHKIDIQQVTRDTKVLRI